MLNLNGHYIREADDARLAELVLDSISARSDSVTSPDALRRLVHGMAGLKPRAKTTVELADNAAFYALSRPIVLDAKASKILANGAKQALADLTGVLAALKAWDAPGLEAAIREFVAAREAGGLDLRSVAQPLRAALTGSTTSPPIFEVMEVLGRTETLGRLADTLETEG